LTRTPAWCFELKTTRRSPGADRVSTIVSQTVSVKLIGVMMSLVDGGHPPPKRKSSKRAAPRVSKALKTVADTLIHLLVT
jgi:hypothetical protein